MSFEVKHTLQGAEAYRDYDYNRANQKETPMVPFAEISQILENWGETLFAESFRSAEGFEKIKSFNESEQVKASDVDQRIKNAALFLHGTTWKSLCENKKPSDEQLTSITTLFKEIADSLESATDVKTKEELTQLSLHPRMLTKCSRVFIESASLYLNDMEDIEYSIEDVLYKNRELHEKDSEITDALRRLPGHLPSELINKEGLEAIKAGISYPYFNTMRYTRDANDSIGETLKYFAATVSKATKEERELTDYEKGNLDALFKSLVEHLKNIQASYALYNPKNEANNKLNEAQETLAKHVEESAERKKELTSAHENAVAEHKEAAAAQKGSLEEVLADEVKARQEKVDSAKQKLDETVKADEAKLEELTQAVAEAQENYNKLLQDCKNAPLYEKYVSNVKDETVAMIEKMNENMNISVICMKDFLSFAQDRTDRELKKNSSWFGISLW